MADEQKAIDFLTNAAKDAAKGLAEESEVYRIAENIVEDNKALFGTVNTILNKELGISFDVGKDKEIGFMLNPEKKKAELGFKMKFASEGTVGFLPEEVKKLTVWDAINDRIARLTDEVNAGQMTKSSLDEAKLFLRDYVDDYYGVEPELLDRGECVIFTDENRVVYSTERGEVDAE